MTRAAQVACSRLALLCPGGGSLRPRLHRLRGVSVGANVWIGLYVYIDELHPERLSIGDNVSIGIRTTIVTHFYWGPRRQDGAGTVVIENDVFVGPHCVILPNVRIGQGAVIQAGTVVSRNVPPATLWGGPAAGPLARVSVPLAVGSRYDEFVRGLQPSAAVEEPAGAAR